MYCGIYTWFGRVTITSCKKITFLLLLLYFLRYVAFNIVYLPIDILPSVVVMISDHEKCWEKSVSQFNVRLVGHTYEDDNEAKII